LTKEDLQAQLQVIVKHHEQETVWIGTKLAEIAKELVLLIPQFSRDELGELEVACNKLGKATLENITEQRCRIQGTIYKITTTTFGYEKPVKVKAEVVKPATVTEVKPAAKSATESSTKPNPITNVVKTMTPAQLAQFQTLLAGLNGAKK
jgi:hypothetical protein